MYLIRFIQNISKSHNFRHGVLYTLFSFINNGVSFILLLVLANYLQPSDYGSLSLFNTFVTLLNIFISLSTASYVSVTFFQAKRGTLQKIIFIALGTSTVTLITFSSFLIILPNLAEKYIGINLQYLWLGLFICYFQVFTSLNLEVWRLKEKPLSYGIFSISLALLNFALTLWFIAGLDLNWEGRVYSQFSIYLLYFIFSVKFLIKKKFIVLTLPDKSLIFETFSYALPLVPHVMSFWLRQGLDRYIINYFWDNTYVGYFSFAMNISSIVVMIGQAFNSTNSVYIFKKLSEGYVKSKEILDKQNRIMFWVFIFCTIFICMFAYALIGFFIPQYIGSLPYIIPLCIGGLCQCIYLLWVNYLFYYKNTKQLMYITFLASVIQVILSIWLTRYGTLYTAIISMFTNALIMGLVYFRAKKILLSQFKIEVMNNEECKENLH